MAAQDELQAWYNGTVNGGPNGDGRYPLTYKDGTVHLVLCPAAQAVATADDTSAPQQFAQDAEASATAAQTAQTAAEAAASSATASANTATTKAGEASASATAAAASTTAAATSETNAAASKTAAAASATNAATSETNAGASATAANTAKTDAQAARDLAQKWASNPVDSVVSGGLYSAYHWAQKAMSTVSGLLHYMGSYDASGNAYPASPTKGDFWKISTAGTLGGVAVGVGDQIIYNGVDWDHIDNTEAVTSVAGRVGAITLSIADIASLQTTLDGKQASLGYTPVNRAAATIEGTADSRITFNINSGRRGLLAVNPTAGTASFVVYQADGGTSLGQLDIGTGGMKYDGNSVWHAGNFDPATKANTNGQTFTGTVQVPYLIAGDGNGTASIRVGNDTNLWDVNIANAMGVKGVADPTKGYIFFGSAPSAFGWNGANLVYGSATIWHSGNFDINSRANRAQYGVTDFNTITTPGLYVVQGGSPNEPSPGDWSDVMFMGDANYGVQISSAVTESGNLRYRKLSAGTTWNAWATIADSSNLASLGIQTDGKRIENRLTKAQLQDTTLRSGLFSNDGQGLLNAAGTGDALSGWWHVLNMFHDSNGYGAQLALELSSTGANTMYLRTSSGTSWREWSKVWTEVNFNPANYAALSAANTFTGRLTGTAMGTAGGMANSSGNLGAIWCYNSASTSSAAFMAFHRANSFACYFGLDTDNKLKVGGWSMGNAAYEIHHDGNYPVSEASTVSTLAKRNASGDINVRLVRSEYTNEGSIPSTAALGFRNNNTTDNYERHCNNPAAVRGWLGIYVQSADPGAVADGSLWIW